MTRITRRSVALLAALSLVGSTAALPVVAEAKGCKKKTVSHKKGKCGKDKGRSHRR